MPRVTLHNQNKLKTWDLQQQQQQQQCSGVVAVLLFFLPFSGWGWEGWTCFFDAFRHTCVGRADRVFFGAGAGK